MRKEPIYLSDLSARAARPNAKEYALPDNRLSGFGLRVQSTGTKSWVLRLKVDGAAKRVTLGNTQTMSAEEARARAHQLLAAHAPPDIALLAADDKPAIKLNVLAQRFLKARREIWKPTTLKSVKIYLNSSILPALGEHAINRLTTSDIAEWFHTYSTTSPGGANQALSHLRSMLKFARESGILPPDVHDPSKPIRRNTRRARGRLLNAGQLAQLGTWLEAPPIRWLHVADAIRLILLTGCRSGEIARLTWAEVGSDKLSLRDTKTGKRNVILSRPAIEILDRCRHGARSAFVFPHPAGSTRPIASIDTAWRAIRAQVGLPDEIRLHDLRHTYASHAIMIGESLNMAGKLLGHRRPKTTEIYSHIDADILGSAADRIGTSISVWLDCR
ncbi:site-specific integrase [Hyphomonas oceanitis]|uniref:Phage integrase n=1 Tax=Hyphomonas oceanitis SCH89 TaxID=1280953 RepID=A0A059G4Y3_9PROT|nr:site-specific integrase [Hyphomonas oceanitis]KDA01789.1 phage integrase [Hyphomonas oceanitis SCH89]